MGVQKKRRREIEIEIEIEMYGEERKVHREARMTCNLIKVGNRRMTCKSERSE